MAPCPVALATLALALTNCAAQPVTCVTRAPVCPNDTATVNPADLIAYRQLDVQGVPANAFSAFWYLSRALPGLTRIAAHGAGAPTLDCSSSTLEALASLVPDAPSFQSVSLTAACEFNATDALLAGAAPFLLFKSVGIANNTAVQLLLTNPGACNNGPPGPPLSPPAVAGLILGLVALLALALAVAQTMSSVATNSSNAAPPAELPQPAPELAAGQEQEPPPETSTGSAHFSLLRVKED